MDALAEEVRSEFLGRLVPPPEGSGAMKASVMARLRGSATPPSHNKYSGIQEWLNAVVLFVNVASAKGQFYDNLFLEGGRRMTWFAQPNHVRETPAIARILATGAAEDGAAGRAGGEDGAAGGGAAPVPVLLFCRQARSLRKRMLYSGPTRDCCAAHDLWTNHSHAATAENIPESWLRPGKPAPPPATSRRPHSRRKGRRMCVAGESAACR